MNSFSKFAVNLVNKEYKNYIIDEYNISAIAIGGSVARGYANEGSDVDLLMFCENTRVYKKKFVETHNTNIELHYIPTSVVKYHSKALETIAEQPIIKNNFFSDNTVLGEKKCELFNNDYGNNLGKILNAWRELKKMTDVIIIKDNNNYKNFRYSFHNIVIDYYKILELADNLVQKENPFETVVSLLKLSAIYNKDVFSKVFWTDEYLLDKPKVKKIIYDILELNQNSIIPKEWLSCANNVLCEAITNQKEVNCSVCHGVLRRCNLGRCLYDYLYDTNHAIKANYTLGSWLSFKKAIDYSIKLSSITGQEINMPATYYKYWDKKNRVPESDMRMLIDCLFN